MSEIKSIRTKYEQYLQDAQDRQEANTKKPSREKEEMSDFEIWALTIKEKLDKNPDDEEDDLFWDIMGQDLPIIDSTTGKLDKEVLSQTFILDDSLIPQRLDHAVGFIKIGERSYRYYGVNLFENVEKKHKNGTIIMKEKVSALILENGSIVSENTKPVGCNFEFDSVMTLKYNRWGLNSIKQFCSGEIKDVSFKKVYDSFKRFYDEGMVFECEEWYVLNPIWDMCTYYYDLEDKFLIIKHEGVSGTAKSKGMKISVNLSFNGKKFLCPRPANFFRYRHHNKATLYIEEAERLFDDSKRKSADDSDLVEYLNGSYERGNTVPRQNDKNINQTDEFDPAGFSRIGAIKPLKGALEKRSIPLFMVKASSKDKRGDVEPPAENDPEYSSARNLAYVNGLLNYRKFQDALKNVKNEFKLANRQWLVAKPLIAMADCISPEIGSKIGRFVARLFDVRDSVVDESSWTVRLGLVLISILCQHEGKKFVATSVIRDFFLVDLASIGQEQYARISTHKITKLMQEDGLAFGRFRCRNKEGTQRGFEVGFYDVCDILVRNEILDVNKIKKKVSEVSGCQSSNNSDNIDMWYIDSFSDTHQTVSEFSDILTDKTLFPRGIEEEKVEDKSDTIHLKCFFCGSTPCVDYELTGNPICQNCKNDSNMGLRSGGKK